MNPFFWPYVIMDYQRKLRRAEARARLSVEEQAAWGWLDDQAAPIPARRRRRQSGLRKAWVRVLTYCRLRLVTLQ
jgi:hypothetical protein